MEKEEIKSKIIAFIEENVEVKLSSQITDSEDSLLNPKYGIEPRDLLMMVFELERMFFISIHEEDVTENRLDYINNLCEWVYHQTKVDADINN